MGEIALIVGATASVVGAVDSYNTQKDVAKETEKKTDLEQAHAGENASRRRREQIKEARIQRGLLDNAAAGIGQGGSSAAVGGGQSIVGDAAGNIAQINTAARQGKQISNANQSIFDAGQTSTIGQLAGVTGSIANIFTPPDAYLTVNKKGTA